MEDEYYKKVSTNDWYKFALKNATADISDSQKNIISNMILAGELFTALSGNKFLKSKDVNVFRYVDEWYLVTIYNGTNGIFTKSYYLCDQFDGLLKCIEDNYGK